MYKASENGVVHVEIHRGCKPYSRQIFGQFVEHFHRQIYGGIFEPGSHLSDEIGFRTDVIKAVRGLRVPIVRSEHLWDRRVHRVVSEDRSGAVHLHERGDRRSTPWRPVATRCDDGVCC